ncbi:MAG: extracellular solute-binding protein [Candidatus Limiplasma sp.]|nr:extracellular solute-binding protein [Candidatus Limiplasma sp.]
MKKGLALLLALVLCMTALSAMAEAGGTLVLYSTESDDLINLIVPGFEAKYGIKVETVTAGTGEMIKRIDSEQSSPLGDVLLGASYLMAKSNEHLFESYVSPENEFLLEDFRFDGVGTYKVGCSVLLVNKDLIGDIQVKGYKDLLNPALKGKIAAADAAASSSSFDHLVNMLVDFSPKGENESDEAREFVQNFLYNVDGKILGGSSAVHKGVVDGEYVVGVTYEDPAASYVKNGATNVEVVYMEEGVIFFGSALNIIKGAKNMDNAKLFVDYVYSAEVQDKLGTMACLRPVREGATVGDHMKPLSEINVKTVSNQWVSENKDRLTAEWTDMMTNVE